MKLAESLKYRQLRAEGYPAHQALSFARINVRFMYEPRVRMNCEPEWCDYEFPTYEGCRTSDIKRYEEEDRREAEREGIWTYFSEYQDNKGEWHWADSVGWVIGDLDSTGYQFQLMEAALIALEEENQREADLLEDRATYAGVRL